MATDFYEWCNIIISDNYRILPFQKHHIYLLDNDKFQQIMMEQIPDFPKWVEAQALSGPCVTVFEDGKPLLCFGFVMLWNGVAEGWMLKDKSVIDKYLHLGRFSRLLFKGFGTVLRLHRIQFHISCIIFPATRFAEFLKFKKEGILKQYGPDKIDFYIYGRNY